MAKPDATATTSSRFLALPAEMRNRIYSYALHHDRAAGEYGAVNILRTCRQIHQEAKELLYETSTFTITASTPQKDSAGPDTRILILEGDLKATVAATGEYHFGSGPAPGVIYDELPTALRKVKTVDLQLDPSCYITTQNFLFALACFLISDDTKCTSFSIHVIWADKLKPQLFRGSYEHVWYPLAKLPPQIKVTIDGNINPPGLSFLVPPAATIHGRYLQNGYPHPACPASVKMNTIVELRRVDAFAREYINAARQFDASGGLRSYLTREKTLHYELERRLGSIKLKIERDNMRTALDCWFGGDSEWGCMIELWLIETWAKAAASGTPLWKQGPGAELKLRKEAEVRFLDKSEIDEWQRITREDITKEVQRLKAAASTA